MSKTFVCVFKSGVFSHSKMDAEYSARQVQWLREQIRKHYPMKHNFICLSDEPIPGVDTIKLRHNWPGWWSKMELFRPDMPFHQAFYLDLDTVITGSLVPLVKRRHKFTILRNLTKLSDPVKYKRHNALGSAVMAWDTRRHDPSYLYQEFLKDPDKHIARYGDERIKPHRWGDQGFLQDHLKKWDYFQDAFPNAIRSFKNGLDEKNNPLPGTKIVCFHGRTKPWNFENASWIPPIN